MSLQSIAKLQRKYNKLEGTLKDKGKTYTYTLSQINRDFQILHKNFIGTVKRNEFFFQNVTICFMQLFIWYIELG